MPQLEQMSSLAARNLSGCQDAAKFIVGKYGAKAVAKSMDVHDSKAVNSVVKEVVDEYWKDDVLVNSAGVPGSEKTSIGND
jgi:NADP-dependent 3-hydroxy acid dehydrogenase YdfG